MNSAVQDQFEEFVNLNEDELLSHALDESLKHYNEVEIPRRTGNPTPSTSSGLNDVGHCSHREQEIPRVLLESNMGAFSGLDENGFNLGAGSTWIYPTNYPIRDYQYNIVQNALFKNTLVSLPTGLGKTFIAAVVMFNFYRWYPEGKILFLAPTRPLVTQQIESCYKVMGIPQDDTAELTGQIEPSRREIKWRTCRMFFLTPQSLMSDLNRSTCPVEKIRCIVFDEAHRATGNYDYCQVISTILTFNKHFRVLALSATPGNDLLAVQKVIDNLLIDHIEVRDESSLDTASYSNKRVVDTIVVKLSGFHEEVYFKYLQILGPYMDILLRRKLIHSNGNNIAKFALFLSRDKFRSRRDPGMSRDTFNQIESHYAICITLAHGLELLTQQGLRSFIRYLRKTIDEDSTNHSKFRLRNNEKLCDLLSTIEERIGQSELTEPSVNTSIGEICTQSPPEVYSHPKMEKLRDVIINHFQKYENKNEGTRAMIFCQYRDTVVEVCHVLARLKPLVRAMSFVGQASGKLNKGFTQKEQLRIMEKFRAGDYNTLVSTSIGEEGLDIGEVDLIICYDTQSSAIRLVQRMGRTGRKREGRIVMLLTHGKEKQKYDKSLYNNKSMKSGLANCKWLKFNYSSPRMVPENVQPSCYKMFMTVPKALKNKNIKKMFQSKRKNFFNAGNVNKILERNEDDEIPPDILPSSEYLHAMDTNEALEMSNKNPSTILLASDLDEVLDDTETEYVSRSRVASDYQELLEFAGRRRCDIPLTQSASLASQVCRNDLWPSKKRKKGLSGPSKKKKKLKATKDDKQDSQPKISSLWTNIVDSKDTKKTDSALMPPPSSLPVRKADAMPSSLEIDIVDLDEEDIYEIGKTTTAAAEESFVQLKEKLILSEEILNQIEELQENSLCYRFSVNFSSSGLSSLISSTCEEMKSKESNLRGLLHGGFKYYEDILNPDVWKSYSMRQGDDSCVDFLKQYDTFTVECALDSFPKHMPRNFPKHMPQNAQILSQNICHEISEEKDELNLQVETNGHLQENVPISHNSKFCVKEMFQSRKCNNDFNISGTTPPHEVIEEEPNFDLGISQLLCISPESSQVVVSDVQTEKRSYASNISENNMDSDEEFKIMCSQEVLMKRRKVTFTEHGNKMDCYGSEEKLFSDKPEKENLGETSTTAPDNDELSKFVEESMLKWWKEENEFKLEDEEGISEGPLSPILSSQRNRSYICSSSTPKCSNINLDLTNKQINVKKSLKSFASEKRFVRTENINSNFEDSFGIASVVSKKRKNITQSSESLISGTSFQDSENNLDSSLDDFEIPVKSIAPPSSKSGRRKKKEKCVQPNSAAVFIENEAEESREDRRSSSDGESASGLDELEESFVDDAEDSAVNDSVDIHAQYLESVKSPLRNQGCFKIKKNDNFCGNVYSQALTKEELNEDYEQDSFCVDTDSSSSSHNKVVDTLDIIEAALEKKKKKKKKLSVDEPKKKRKRIRMISSSSDESNHKDVNLISEVKEDIESCFDLHNNLKSIDLDDKNSIKKSTISEKDEIVFRNSDSCDNNGIVNSHDSAKTVNLNDLIPSNIWDDSFEAGDECTDTIKTGDDKPQPSTFLPVSENNCSGNNDSSNVRKKLKFLNDKTTQKGLMTDFFSSCSTNQRINNNSPADVHVDIATDKGRKQEWNEASHPANQNFHNNDLEKLVVIVSSQYVTSASEIISALKSRHKMNVRVHSIQFAHFIISCQVGVIRVTFEDFCRSSDFESLQDVSKNLMVHFLQSYIIVEQFPKKENGENNMWPANCIDFISRLRLSGIKILYSQNKASTADLLANLTCREYSCGRTITVSQSLSSQMPVIGFLESFPSINMASALKVCAKYKSISEFLKSCKSVAEIRASLGVSREAARNLYFILNDVL